MNDADIETRELENAGNTISRLKKKGICCHGWIKAPAGCAVICLDCGKIWKNYSDFDEEREQIKMDYF